MCGTFLFFQRVGVVVQTVEMAEKYGIRAKYITANEGTVLLSLIDARNEILFNKSHDFRIIKRKKKRGKKSLPYSLLLVMDHQSNYS